MRSLQLHDFRWVLAAFGFFFVEACRHSDEVSSAFVSESRWAQQATMLAGTHARVSAVQLSETSVSQTWVVPDIGEWERYTAEVAQRLEPAYRCREPLAEAMTCVRELPGDHLELTLTPRRDA